MSREIDKIWVFKNFRMGNELEIAGEFVYDSAKRMMSLQNVFNEFEINSILYNGAVGIERLQKILLCLYCVEKEDDLKHPIQCLLGHNHSDLHANIQTYIDCGFNKNHIFLLDVFRDYYKEYRYSNYTIERTTSIIDLIERVFKKKNNKFSLDKPVTSIEMNGYYEFYINVLGQMARKYYSLIRQRALELDMYTYELDSLSNAARVLWGEEKVGLYEEMSLERLSIKEFLLFLRKNNTNNGLFEIMEKLKPLDYDRALINEYISELIDNRINDYLIGETESFYEELSLNEQKQRKAIMELIGNRDLFFDFDCESEDTSI